MKSLKKEQETSQQEKEQEPALDFTVLIKMVSEVKLSDFAGKPAVVRLSASWCGHVRWRCRILEEKYREFGGEINF